MVLCLGASKLLISGTGFIGQVRHSLIIIACKKYKERKEEYNKEKKEKVKDRKIWRRKKYREMKMGTWIRGNI
jgi:hypothetical protein